MINHIQNYIAQNWFFLHIPFYLICLFYVVLLIGWFFSTDYYDKFYASIEDGDFIWVHLYFIFLIITNLVAFYISGPTNLWSMVWSGAVWVIFIGAYIVNYMIKARMYFRRKRGKK